MGKNGQQAVVGSLPTYICPVHGDVKSFGITFMVKDDPKPQGPYCLECLRILAVDQLKVCKEVKGAAGNR